MHVRRIAAAAAILSLSIASWGAAPALAGRARAVRRADAPAAEDGIIRAGLKPIDPAPPTEGSQAPITLGSSAAHGAVVHRPEVYLVFWGTQWSSDPAGAAPALQDFFEGLHGTVDTWSNIMLQSCSGLPAGTVNCGAAGDHVQKPGSSILAGVWFDNDGPEPTNANGTQIANEAVAAAQHFGNTTAASNFETQYVIASPTGTHPDGFPSSGFCAWHSSVTRSGIGTVAYTNLPYVPDLGAGGCTTISSPTLLDGYFSTETHEYAESVTDLWPAAGWSDSSGAENADKCVDFDARLTLSTGTFDVQGLWSNSHAACRTDAAGPATSPRRPDAIIRRGTAPNLGDGIYNTTAANQTRSGSAGPGGSVTFKVTAQNDGTTAEAYTLHAAASSPSFTVRYLNGASDVTAAVKNGTFTTPTVAPGRRFVLTMQVTVKPTAPAGATISRPITVTSVVSPTKADTVKATIARA